MEKFMNQKEYQLSWLKVLGVILLIAVIAFIIYLVYPKKENNEAVLSTYNNNLKLMKEAGREYFKGTNLPSRVGEARELTLEDMVSSKLIMDILDENGNTCDLNKSYIRATKENSNEYSLKVTLTCENMSDYVITTIVDEAANNNAGTLDNNTSSVNNPDLVDNENNNNSSSNNSSSNNNSGSNTSSNVSSSNGNGGYTNKPSTPSTPTVQNNYNITYESGCQCTSTNCSNCSNKVYHSVYFETNGGTYVARQVIEHGKTAEYRSTSKDGYRLVGWYTDASLRTLYTFSEPVYEQITLYAKWEKIDDSGSGSGSNSEYTVTFDPQNGENAVVQRVVKGGTASRIQDPTKPCATFIGWYYNGIRYDFNTPVTGNITLIARYEENVCRQEYTVRFDANGGTGVGTQYILEGNYASRPADPTRSGYRFVGWYYNNQEFNFNTRIYQDYTLVARWEKDTVNYVHTVRFNSNGGTSVSNQYVYDGNYASRPSNPTRNGYKFVGWYYNNQEFNFNTRIYQDYTLEARWEKANELYSTYCRIVTDTYYSVSLAGGDQKTKNLSWQIKFDDIGDTNNLKITEVGYLNSLEDYNKLYRKNVVDKGLTMVGGDSKNDVLYTSGLMLRTYSLKSSNFTKNLSQPYYKNGSWYVDASVTIRNYNNAVSYYAENQKSYVYFIPFYFNVRYTDYGDCVEDLADNWPYYAGYEIVDTYSK